MPKRGRSVNHKLVTGPGSFSPGIGAMGETIEGTKMYRVPSGASRPDDDRHRRI